MARCIIALVLSLAYLQSCMCYVPRFINGRPKGGMLGLPVSSQKNMGPLPAEQWFDQRLDHFDDLNIQTWKQRYFVNAKYYKMGGPAFLQIGGEGPADPIWMVEGTWVEYAKKDGAILFQVEHRYYGKSHPTENLSTDNLRYLSSVQSLEDMAYFVQYAKYSLSSYGLKDAKWIAFGGSYSGALAAWLRMKYPHLITGAVATSAPVLARYDFKEYMGVVRDSLATTGSQCNAMIQKGNDQLGVLYVSEQGRKQIKEKFRLCDDLSTIKLDAANLLETLAGNFAGVVQYNKDNREFEGAVGTNITVDTLCDIMMDTTITAEIDRLAKVNTLLLNTYGESCLDFVYSKMVQELRRTEWNSSAGAGGRQWQYQTCTEFAYFQTSDLGNQPFGHSFPIGFSVQQCMDIYDGRMNADFIQQAVNNTNTHYGGLGIQVTKVVFPNGSIDPWHALGILTDLSPEATAVYIKGTAHCANMYPATNSDSPQLRAARQTIQELIGKWIQ